MFMVRVRVMVKVIQIQNKFGAQNVLSRLRAPKICYELA